MFWSDVWCGMCVRNRAMTDGENRTQVSIKDTIACVRRHRMLSKEFRKFKKRILKSEVSAIVSAWFLHSRTQTMGAKFLRAGEKSVNRVTGAAGAVTGAAVNVISFVNPINVLGAWSSPFSTPAPGPVEKPSSTCLEDLYLEEDGSCLEKETPPSLTQRRLARNLPSARTASSIPDHDELFSFRESADDEHNALDHEQEQLRRKLLSSLVSSRLEEYHKKPDDAQ